MSVHILIIDDEPHLPHQLARFLRKQGYEVTTAVDGETGLQELQKNLIDLVLLDLRLPRISGLDVLTRIRQQDSDLPVIMFTAYGDVQTAVSAMKQGASEYLLKGFNLDELLVIVQRALETSAMYRELRQLRRERRDTYRLSYLVGQSEQMRQVFEMVERIARSDTASVLITGESGSGKEVVANAIHEQSARASGPFHPLNCAAIAQNLLESELFGYEPHAFTDAKKQKRGLLELADQGTLFLDEIGEMPLEMQSKLLRVLETRSFYRLGGSKEVHINVRVLAATNRNLEQAMREGTFRSDLYYRLAVLRLHLPPLRDRVEDILLFAARFIEEFNRSLGRTIKWISPEARHLLLAYPWPGNIRELKNVIERAMILSSGDEILPTHLPQEIISWSGREQDPWDHWLSLQPSEPLVLEDIIGKVERHIVQAALKTARQNRPEAVELLGLSKVDQLRYLMRKYKIE